MPTNKPGYMLGWTRSARLKLREVLGNCCKRCGTTQNLEFDCIEPTGDTHHKMSSSGRVSFYRQQHRLSNLQLLCSKCHRRKTADDMIKLAEMEEAACAPW